MAPEADVQNLAVESFRSYLLLLARLHLGGQGKQKLEPSDLVQQTLLDAHRQRAQFRGRTASEMAAWLRRMLACNLADGLRAQNRAKRDLARERSLEEALANSSARLESWLAADQSTPSQQAVRNEQLRRLAEAVTALPEAQGEAVVLHYLQGMPLATVAAQMGRSPASVAGLLQRGLKALRVALTEPE